MARVAGEVGLSNRGVEVFLGRSGLKLCHLFGVFFKKPWIVQVDRHRGAESKDTKRAQRDGVSFHVGDGVVLGLGRDRAVTAGLRVL